MSREESTIDHSYPTSRRRFLKRGILGLGGAMVGGMGYGMLEASWLRLRRTTISVPRLPTAFDGLKCALLSDVHHGPFTSLDFIDHAVGLANSLNPDVVLLTGDFVLVDRSYIAPCMDVLGRLRAPGGVFGVLGNHDHWEGRDESKHALALNDITELDNTGVWLRKDGQRLRIAGVDDLWEGRPNLRAALGDTDESEAAILMSHNPDFVEGIRDSRVGLVVSGHTHGGQVVFPVAGALRVPSRHGQKYLEGLVKTDHTQVFVTCGVGTTGPPVRFLCRPEVVELTLVSA